MFVTFYVIMSEHVSLYELLLVHEITTLTFFSINTKCVIRCEFLHLEH